MPDRPGPSRFVPPLNCATASTCYGREKCLGLCLPAILGVIKDRDIAAPNKVGEFWPRPDWRIKSGAVTLNLGPIEDFFPERL